MVETSRYYSRQIAVLGQESFHKVNHLHILVSGLRGIGIECAKNLVLTGVGEVTLHDDTLVSSEDLPTNFFIRSEDIGVKTRSQASHPSLQALNTQVKVHCKEGQIDESFLSHFSLVIFCDTSVSCLLHLNHYCRTKNPPIGFISCESWGPFCYLFVDLGPEFIVYDKTGEENKSYYISNITKENPGLVTVYERHFLEDGDYVVFKEVQGMEEINNTPPRPVRAINQYSFSIEDTTGYSYYQKEGIVEHFKIPQKLRFKSLEANILKPSLVSHELHRAEQLHICTRAISEFVKTTGRLPGFNSRTDADEVCLLATTLNTSAKENNLLSVDNIDFPLLQKISMHATCQHPSIVAFLGAVASSEALKFTGKFLPIMQWANFDWIDIAAELFPESGQSPVLNAVSQESLRNSEAMVVGMGALGSEILKQCLQLGLRRFTLVDNGRIKASDRHMFYSAENEGMQKVEVARGKVLEKYENAVIRTEQVDSKCIQLSDEDWGKYGCVVSAVDNHRSRLNIDKLCVWYEKVLVEGSVNSTMGSCHVYKPFKTPSYGESLVEYETHSPMDTIVNFPHSIDQCIEFAKLKFTAFFETTVQELVKLLEDPAAYAAQEEDHDHFEVLQSIYHYIELLNHNTFEECLKFARDKFQELFNDSIARLIASFPQDSKDQAGKSFWSGYRRFPTPTPIELADSMHTDFVEAFATLLATSLGIEHEKISLKEVKESAHLQRTHSIVDLQVILSAQTPRQFLAQINPQKFDCENALHLSFVYSLSTIRARCYKVSETDIFVTQIIAGKIIGCLPSTVSAIAACACIEIQRLVGEYSSNTMVNLGNFAKISWDMDEPKKKYSVEFDPELCAPVKAFPEGFTVWDKITLTGPLSLTAVISKFSEDFSLKINLLTIGEACVYNGFVEGNENMEKTIEELSEVPAGKRCISLEVSCEDIATGTQVVNPIIKYNLS